MAVNLMAAPTAINNPLNRYSYHQDFQRNHTPGSSNSNTPSSVSPISPRNVSTSTSPGKYPYNSRQLRPLKTPNYIPAVLRPTENPSRHRPTKSSSSNSVSRILASSAATPITPPSSNDSSFSSREGQKKMEDTIQQRLLASEGISRVVTDEWNDNELEDVTGAPTRDHWKPDSSSPTCDAPICAIPFTLLRRRHHCRRCGNIYCAPHSSSYVPLDQHARFHPDGNMARACGNCWNDYVAWKRRRGERGSASSGSGSGTVSAIGSGAATPVPRVGSSAGLAMAGAGASAGVKKDATLSSSLGPQWNWSTF